MDWRKQSVWLKIGWCGLLVFVMGCSTPRSHSNPWKAGRSGHHPSDKYILWQRCQPNGCEFLEEYGPTPLIPPKEEEKFRVLCFEQECERLERFGPNETRRRTYHRGHKSCSGKECERLTEFGPNQSDQRQNKK